MPLTAAAEGRPAELQGWSGAAATLPAVGWASGSRGSERTAVRSPSTLKTVCSHVRPRRWLSSRLGALRSGCKGETDAERAPGGSGAEAPGLGEGGLRVEPAPPPALSGWFPW